MTTFKRFPNKDSVAANNYGFIGLLFEYCKILPVFPEFFLTHKFFRIFPSSHVGRIIWFGLFLLVKNELNVVGTVP